MHTLIRSGPDRADPDAIPVVALAHNEANILPDFLDHYRSLGRVSFLIVDDQSTDGTSDILSDAPDVTIFHPTEGSTYSQDKAAWRSELLDSYGDGKWCLVPDLDEHFVFLGAENLGAYIALLEDEGSDAVVTLMIDMYSEAPLRDHVHDPADGVPLCRRFNRFDGPNNYVMRRATYASLDKYPTPPVVFHGGPRHKIRSGPLFSQAWPIVRRLLKAQLGLDQPISRAPGRFRRLLIDPLAKRHCSTALNMTKIGLLRWRRGLRFNGGAHKLNAALPVSESIAGFLHYPFTRGEKGIVYTAARGQHAGGGKHYQAFMMDEVLDTVLTSADSRIFNSVEDLYGLLRPVPM